MDEPKKKASSTTNGNDFMFKRGVLSRLGKQSAVYKIK